MTMQSRVLVASILSALGCSTIYAAGGIDDWIAQNTGAKEKVVCGREVNGEYFFVSRAGDKVRLGSRLNMTEYTETHVFLVGWRLQNENDESLVAKVRPISIRDEYVRNGEMVFAENVQYQTLRRSHSKTIHVTIHVKKCQTSECDRQKTISKREKQYVVDLCTSPLNN
jgi:hypothetical protein